MFQQDMQAVPGTPGGGGASGAGAGGGGILDQLKANIAGRIESGGQPNGGYGALGPVTRSGDRAYGKYQIMGNNIPQWTQEVLGQPMSKDAFLANPQAQEAVTSAKLGQYMNRYGPNGAAHMWFTGSPTSNAADVNGMTGNR